MGKNPPANAGNAGLILGSEDPLKEITSKSNPVGNPMNRGTWWAAVHGVIKRVRQGLATKQQQARETLE